jgi:hypothetical protein
MLHRLESLGMVNTIFAFFSSFNPIVFCLILACGALIVFRRPAPATALRAPERPRTGANATWRRSH